MNKLKDFQIIVDNFKDRVNGVNKLLILDELIIGSTIEILKDRQESLKNCGIDNAHMLGEAAIQQLSGIRDHESLKQGYKLIYNQCVVLLVSYFTSSAHDLFNTAATVTLKDEIPKKLKDKDIKLSLEELKSYNFNLSNNIGSIISAKFDISFQDMKSISRAMKDYFGVDTPIDKTINNIITMQACRHAIAHAGEEVDQKLLNQLRNASDRDIQINLKLGDKIEFTPNEIKVGGSEMIKYINNLAIKITGG